jgi:hypothetical protein
MLATNVCTSDRENTCAARRGYRATPNVLNAFRLAIETQERCSSCLWHAERDRNTQVIAKRYVPAIEHLTSQNYLSPDPFDQEPSPLETI